ncbi:hypothetical protein K503DRAFT_94555 [Rhizopogon vinicolor AM-OR11-026]|uniref:Uncharacterized protein n=1 Tax=Rhizopogon vinicolor AM-OR11-026 TaxID=1314800 RepID=A0A1B7N3F2_9AGAM|nr:hypothetical protein K503DRAFT_94555 [Rhizopogon vinicolor AM-OR11-026]
MAAALQQACGNAVDSQTSRGQAAAVAPGSQVVIQGQPSQLTPRHNSSPGIEEPSYVIGCCGFDVHFVRRRSTYSGDYTLQAQGTIPR